MKTVFACFTLALLLSIFSCKKNNCDDYNVGYGTIQSINSTDTISAGENSSVTLVYHTSQSCQYFESFEEIRDGYNWKINIKIVNDPCNGCFMTAQPKSATYQFQTELPGTYILDFGKNSVFDTIVVQ